MEPASGPHPEERRLSLSSGRVSKDGSLHGSDPRPSFETHRLRDAPQDEVGDDALAFAQQLLDAALQLALFRFALAQPLIQIGDGWCGGLI
jgi:hypothetical protein